MLEATLPSLDGLDENLHDEYEATDDGQYRLKILSKYVPADEVEDVTGLKSALHKERENARNASRTIRELQEKFGDIDPEEVIRLREEAEAHQQAELEKKGQWETLAAQQNEKQQKELAKRDEREQRLLKVLREKIVDAEVNSALNELKGNSNLLRPHVAKYVKMVEDDNGNFSNQVVDDAGNPRVNGDGKFFTVKELVSEMRDQETFAPAFEADVKSGAGTAHGGQGNEQSGKKGVIPSDLKRSQMKPKDKVAFIKEFGNEKFQSLPL